MARGNKKAYADGVPENERLLVEDISDSVREAAAAEPAPPPPAPAPGGFGTSAVNESIVGGVTAEEAAPAAADSEAADDANESLVRRPKKSAAPAPQPHYQRVSRNSSAERLFSAGREGCISALAITLIPKEHKQSRRIAAVSQPFGFVVRINKHQRMAVVTPRGYVTDFASIPSIVHWLISPFGKHAEAAVVHDWLYTLGTPGDGKGRKIADKTFVKALRFLGVGFLRRQVMYWAVRVGGGGGYGLKSDFAFRDLPSLTVTDPLPRREPFAGSYHFEPKPVKRKGKRAASAKAEAREAAVAVEPAAGA